MSFEQADRLKALPPYPMAEVARRKKAAIDAGRDVIDFGVGDPAEPAFPFVVESLNRAVAKPQRHKYELGGGLPEFREHIAGYFQKRYGVELDPQQELLALIGSKEGIGHLPLAVLNPGRGVLVPSPGYPVYNASTILAGGKPETLTLTAENGWLPDLEAIPTDVAENAVIMFLNYPNNPTGACADLAFFEKVVAYGRKHDIIIAHDAAYSELYYTDVRPPSILEVPGAKDVAIEFHSASKTFNMTGWRAGFVAGNADVVGAIKRVKSNLDSGVFGAIQEAMWDSYAGLDQPEIIAARKMYRERAEILCEALVSLGFGATPPDAALYLWARVPEGADSMGTATRLLEEADVVGVPGGGFGAAGEGYVRFSVCVPTERIRTAVERMKALQW